MSTPSSSLALHDAQKAALGDHRLPPGHRPGGADLAAEMIAPPCFRPCSPSAKAADAQLRDEIAIKTEHWGVSVSSVEIRDVAIPVALQDAMSRAGPGRTRKQARVILGSAEAEVPPSLSRRRAPTGRPDGLPAARHEHHL